MWTVFGCGKNDVQILVQFIGDTYRTFPFCYTRSPPAVTTVTRTHALITIVLYIYPPNILPCVGLYGWPIEVRGFVCICVGVGHSESYSDLSFAFAASDMSCTEKAKLLTTCAVQ